MNKEELRQYSAKLLGEKEDDLQEIRNILENILYVLEKIEESVKRRR